jgi:hypothetical protein
MVKRGITQKRSLTIREQKQKLICRNKRPMARTTKKVNYSVKRTKRVLAGGNWFTNKIKSTFGSAISTFRLAYPKALLDVLGIEYYERRSDNKFYNHVNTILDTQNGNCTKHKIYNPQIEEAVIKDNLDLLTNGVMKKLFNKTSLGYLTNNSIIYCEIINNQYFNSIINVTCLANNTNRDINKIQIIVKIPDKALKNLVNPAIYSIKNYNNFYNNNINNVRGFTEKELNKLLKTKFNSLENQYQIIYSLYKLGYYKIYCGTNKLGKHIFLDVKYGKDVLQIVRNMVLGAADVICINDTKEPDASNMSVTLQNHNTSNLESKARNQLKLF